MSKAPADLAPGQRTKGVSALDLDGLTVPELTALIAMLEAKRRDKQEQGRAGMLARWREEAAEAGPSFDALMPAPTGTGPGRNARADAGGGLPAKYREPNGEEWSGRGRLPKWVQAVEAGGKNREKFRVQSKNF